MDAFSQSAHQVRDTDYFRDRIGAVQTADQLVDDRRLLRISLGAFGLQDDLENKAFIRKILSEGATNPDSLANRLADDRYARFSEAFGFDNPLVANTQNPNFAAQIVQRFTQNGFEVAVGDTDEMMRLALNAERELQDLSAEAGANDTKWFLIMGTPPLRQVFETALGLPAGFGKLDLDQQLRGFKDKAEARFGTDDISSFSDDGLRNRLVEQFLLQSQLEETDRYSGMSVALQLLQGVD